MIDEGSTAPEYLDEPEEDQFEDVCGECGGDGYIVNDCFEDSCCCEDPELDHGVRTCRACKPFCLGGQ